MLKCLYNSQIVLKNSETSIGPIVFKGVLCHVHDYTVTISDHINQVPGFFLYAY
jgi:hypothetical protein